MNSLKGNKVILRAIEPNDAQLILEWENNELNWQLSNTITPFSKHIIDSYIEIAHRDIFENKQLRLMIDELDGGKTVGAIDLFDFDPYHLRAGVGILINDDSDKRKGYAKESLDLLIDYSRDILALKQLYCNISINNKASFSLFENCGFLNTGIKKKWQRITSDIWEDIYFFQLML